MDAGAVSGLGFDVAAVRRAPPHERMRAAATELEGLWVGQMLKEARPKSSFLGHSFAADTFQDMLSEVLARDAAKAGGFGLADSIVRQVQPDSADAARAGGRP